MLHHVNTVRKRERERERDGDGEEFQMQKIQIQCINDASLSLQFVHGDMALNINVSQAVQSPRSRLVGNVLCLLPNM